MIRWSGHDGEGNTVTGCIPADVARLIMLADDGTDQTATWVAALGAIPDGTTTRPVRVVVRTVNGGPARVDGRFLILDRNHLVIDGCGTFGIYTNLTGVQAGITTPADPLVSNRQHVALTRCTDVTVRGIHVQGPYAGRFEVASPKNARYDDKTAFEHAFQVSGACSGVTVEDCSFAWVGGDGATLTGASSGEAPQTGTTFRRFTGTYPGRQNIAVVHAKDSLFEDVDIRWGARSGLDVEPNGSAQYVHGLTLRRCKLAGVFEPFVATGLDATRNPDLPPGITIRKKDFLLEDCEGVGGSSAHTAVLVSRGCENLTIRRHKDLRNRSAYGINLGGVIGSLIVEDTEVTSGFSSSATYGVNLFSCSGVAITGSTFNEPVGSPNSHGAKALFLAGGTTNAAGVVHSGNRWAQGAQTD